ncbi:MAG: helix-turn-helix domain-containing protein [Promethearchaeota archaeon]|nr:MAG: helix-turn-helix domain-containing protein [Candidatus Lokiarchaeota archaeon]
MENKEEFKKYIKLTTFEQRKLLIDTYLKTHNISQSCKRAGVSLNTFRKWYRRYIEHGIEGIRKPKKHIRKNLGRVPEKYALRAIELKKKNPKWGRRTIASVMNEKNNNNVISPGGVQKVLERAGLWNKIK